jgi:hypothetical protein
MAVSAVQVTNSMCSVAISLPSAIEAIGTHAESVEMLGKAIFRDLSGSSGTYQIRAVKIGIPTEAFFFCGRIACKS